MKCENLFCKILSYAVGSSADEGAIIQIYCQYLLTV